MGTFGRANKLHPHEVRALVCCAIPMIYSEGRKSALAFGLPNRKPDYAKETLMRIWEISDRYDSLALLEKLSEANLQVPVISEIFDHIIKKFQYEIIRGVFTPIRSENLLDMNLPKNFQNLWTSSTSNANNDIKAFLSYLHNPGDTGSTFHNITASLLTSRLNNGVAGYEEAIRSLVVYGFSVDELTKIDNFSAWDLGRCGRVAALAVTASYLDKNTAWQYVLTAGKNAYSGYTSWRQFLAAYFIGRSVMNNSDNFEDFRETIQYLVRDSKSPYQKFPLKST